ncbi:hypothetical protein [Phytoactinopolyspora halotolerans]|uniref:Uncharacterized protein n=1 Tax=Phytoactinopolyspora halotolerans TaxID=1981512 RepID=A0A6L9SH07_9ACTN|nr:hypothetical protein [Phytoactinopolyspora halotolerans]NEE03370.1 hypothetical protein [Phytoactinopolyspora halotolerans]
MAMDTINRAGNVVRVRENPLLRWALEIDGAVSALNGLAYVVAAGALSDLLGLPTALLVPAGAFLVVYGLVLVAMSMRSTVGRAVVRTVIVLNALWVADSIVVAASGWFDASTAGIVWILLQAAVVAGFAVAQAGGLRRAIAA